MLVSTPTPTPKLADFTPLSAYSGGPLQVSVTHEPFLPWVTLEFLGQTEELDHQQALDWFKAHGAANMDAVNSAINQALNFGAVKIVIAKPVFPKSKDPVGIEPKI